MSFPADSWVEVRYPLTNEQEHADPAAWSWLTGWVGGLTCACRECHLWL
jgi:hypothetical protein